LLRPNQNLEADLVQETDEMEAVEIREMEKTVINPAPVPSGTSQTAPRLWKLEAHFGEVSGIAFSRDGRFLVSASLDDTIRVSEPETGSLVWTRNAGQRGVRSISISTDSRFLATGGLDSAVRVRVLEDGAPARILPGHLAAVSQVEFGPGEEYLASADDLGGVILWDFQSGEVRSRWRAHSAQIRTMSFSPDGQWLATAGKERQIRLWAIPSGRPGPVLAAHGDVVHDIAFSPDGDWLASTSHDRSLRIWKTSNWSLERTVQYVSRVNRMTPVAFSHDSRFIATGKPSAVVSVFDVRTASIGRGRNLGPRVEDEGDIVSVAFAADGSAVAAGDSNGWIRVWPFRWEN
jgi:WD40 repeat protein